MTHALNLWEFLSANKAHHFTRDNRYYSEDEAGHREEILNTLSSIYAFSDE